MSGGATRSANRRSSILRGGDGALHGFVSMRRSAEGKPVRRHVQGKTRVQGRPGTGGADADHRGLPLHLCPTVPMASKRLSAPHHWHRRQIHLADGLILPQATGAGLLDIR